MVHEAPDQIEPRILNDYLEVMSKAVFQSGISWNVVESKWPTIREALHNFDVQRIADLTPDDIDGLVADPRVIRNRRKIEGIVHNAQRILELDEKHGSFQAYLRTPREFSARIADLRKQFKFLGDMGCYYFLYVVREPVPPYEEYAARSKP